MERDPFDHNLLAGVQRMPAASSFGVVSSAPARRMKVWQPLPKLRCRDRVYMSLGAHGQLELADAESSATFAQIDSEPRTQLVRWGQCLLATTHRTPPSLAVLASRIILDAEAALDVMAGTPAQATKKHTRGIAHPGRELEDGVEARKPPPSSGSATIAAFARRASSPYTSPAIAACDMAHSSCLRAGSRSSRAAANQDTLTPLPSTRLERLSDRRLTYISTQRLTWSCSRRDDLVERLDGTHRQTCTSRVAIVSRP